MIIAGKEEMTLVFDLPTVPQTDPDRPSNLELRAFPVSPNVADPEIF